MIRLRNLLTTCSLVLLFIFAACSDTSSDNGPDKDPDGDGDVNQPEQNLKRAMELTDATIAGHFTGDGMAMARYYNPYTGNRPDEKGSVWMYTAGIEAVNAILHGLQAQKEHGKPALYDANFNKYKELLSSLYENADYYKGTFELTSYTQTKSWSVYGVNRGSGKGSAEVEGVMNVYDDQMWFIREMLEAYKLTGDTKYLEKAEYLTEYVLDGWDCTRNDDGTERGGITWGPGYITKHSCSNGPMVSPLVWLHELYKDKDDVTTRHYVDATDKKTRLTEEVKKSDYYLDFAKKIYAWQKQALLRSSEGVYDDLMGGCAPNKHELEVVDGVSYRKGVACNSPAGPPYSYNSGSMLSGSADLYRVTGEAAYLADAKKLADDTFKYFAKPNATKQGYYTYAITGFNTWFNGVLARAYVDVAPSYEAAGTYAETFQKNLDYGYDNFAYKGFLPINLLLGWSRDNNQNQVEGMFNFTYAAEYAVLARYQLEK
ncbi:glycoside hydrolase family 76 protein [Dawidia soli]|uniref:Hydrolase n=1 Tax=Dawidia soli TaxID=2782352 RepID=A0AAP2D7X0_9BACT|nr:glycoside hydrolase family 76 protein [Dawidia soli]MBT1687073.1 hydrolase [Dawidia soli]